MGKLGGGFGRKGSGRGITNRVLPGAGPGGGKGARSDGSIFGRIGQVGLFWGWGA